MPAARSSAMRWRMKFWGVVGASLMRPWARTGKSRRSGWRRIRNSTQFPARPPPPAAAAGFSCGRRARRGRRRQCGCTARRPQRSHVPARAAGSGAEQGDLEEQRRVRRNDAAGAARAITELGRDHEPAGTADLQAGDAFVPAADHMAGAERKAKRLAAILARVGLGARLAVLEQPAGVMHRYLVAGTGFVAIA